MGFCTKALLAVIAGLGVGFLVIPKPHVVSVTLPDGGTVTNGNPLQIEVEVRNWGLLPLQVRKPRSSGCGSCGNITVTALTQSIPPLGKTRLHLVIEHFPGPGPLSAQVQMRTNSPIYRSLSIPYSIEVKELLAFPVGSISVRSAEGPAETFHLTARNITSSPVQIEAFLADTNPGLGLRTPSAPVEIRPGDDADLAFTLDPRSPAGNYGGRIILAVKGRQEPYSIPFQAEISGAVIPDRRAVVFSVPGDDPDSTVHPVRLHATDGKSFRVKSCSASVDWLQVHRDSTDTGLEPLYTLRCTERTGAARSVSTAEVRFEIDTDGRTSFVRVPVFLVCGPERSHPS